ncbi:MAG TPA: cation transporter [Candidatus Saccharimonadales bacterium]|nr:cation transporter [Candidatus Saccharimonadales bacterium]
MSTLAATGRTNLLLLQSLTFVWMLLECVVSLISAVRAHSPALLAFGADSLVELLSASLVVLALAPVFNRKQVDQTAGTLLFLLATVVGLTSILALAGKVQPEASPLGIGITAAALLVMPLLAWQKRKLARRTQNSALAADAVQSATCAYLAFITLAGLALNAAFHISWADSLAALGAVPILIVEARRAIRGQSCGCCH